MTMSDIADAARALAVSLREFDETATAKEVDRLADNIAELQRSLKHIQAACVREQEDCAKLREQLAAKDKRIVELEQWKREGIEVESRWDIQEVARELEVPPGYNIRPEILPRIKQLKEQLAAMTERAEHHENIAKQMAEKNTVLRKIASRIPGILWLKAKEDAGFGVSINTALENPKVDEAWVQFTLPPDKERP